MSELTQCDYCTDFEECASIAVCLSGRDEDESVLSRGTCTDCKAQDGPCWCGDTLGCTC